MSEITKNPVKKIFAPTMLGGFVLGIILASILFIWMHSYYVSNNNQLIKNFYNLEVASNVSAHWLRKKIISWDKSFTLVDVRSEEEYLEWHIIGSINIPAYTWRDNLTHSSEDRILEEFEKLGTDKEIITYCYSASCMTWRKIGQYLAQEWVYVKHLTIGWNEWRYHWTLWNYPHEEDDTQKFISSWDKPWNFEWVANDSCGISWDFGC